MLTIAVTEVVQDVLQKDLEHEFPNIVKRYYDENVQVFEFPWDRPAKLGIEVSSPLINPAMGEEYQQFF